VPRQDIAVQSSDWVSSFEPRGTDRPCDVLSRTVGSPYNCDIFLGRCAPVCPSLVNKGVLPVCAGDCSEKNGPPVGQDHGSTSEGCGRRQRWSELCTWTGGKQGMYLCYTYDTTCFPLLPCQPVRTVPKNCTAFGELRCSQTDSVSL